MKATKFGSAIKPLALAVAGTSLLMSATGQAQDLVLEEVVVTAQKRSESVQDVAASITALQGEALQEFNVFEFSQVEDLTPGLTLNDSSVRNQTISLRGLTYDSEGTANPVVDAYWNGIPVRTDVAFGQLYDIERIEVLRGPQGTLQGQTSPGGAIMISTRKADLVEMNGQMQTSFADNERFNTQFGINVPLIEDQLAVRVAGNYDEHEMQGVKNIYTGTTQSSRGKGGRLSVAWQPTDRFSANFTYEYDEQDANDFKDMYGSDALGNGNPDLGKYDRKGLLEADNTFESRNKLSVLEMNWDVTDSLALISISGYQDVDSSDYRDIDRANAVVDAVQVQAVDIDYDVLSQEIRLSTTEPYFGWWDFIVGGFYKDQDLDTHFFRWLSPGSPLAIDAPAIPSDREEYGLFNHNTFAITDFSRVQLGIRWSEIERTNRYDFVVLNHNNGNIIAGPISAIPDNLAEETEREVTGSLKYLHDLNDEIMVYASLDSSFRPGGMTIEPRLTNPDELLYDDETSWAFEVGFKSELWERRLQLNGAAFYQEFDGYIKRATGVLIDSDGDGTGDARASGIMFNGDAIVSGAELEATALLTENWTASGGITYVDAKYDDADVPCDGEPGDYTDGAIFTCNSDGRIGDEPNWSASVNSQYVIPMGDLEGFVRGLYRFTGNRVDDNIKSTGADGTTSSYGVFNLYAGVRDNAGTWEASVWATNLFDKDAEITKTAEEVFEGESTGYRQADIIPERTIGITARYNF
jgi:outer membrane receptor protein involved in Fe transport